MSEATDTSTFEDRSADQGLTLRHATCLALLLGALATTSCSSDPPGTDACKAIETTRCEALAACPGFEGTPQSCKNFYEAQCGRGLQDFAREPTSAELDQCLNAIRASCDVARSPTTTAACSFITALVPLPTPSASDASPDASPDTSMDASQADTIEPNARD